MVRTTIVGAKTNTCTDNNSIDTNNSVQVVGTSTSKTTCCTKSSNDNTIDSIRNHVKEIPLLFTIIQNTDITVQEYFYELLLSLCNSSNNDYDEEVDSIREVLCEMLQQHLDEIDIDIGTTTTNNDRNDTNNKNDQIQNDVDMLIKSILSTNNSQIDTKPIKTIEQVTATTTTTTPSVQVQHVSFQQQLIDTTVSLDTELDTNSKRNEELNEESTSSPTPRKVRTSKRKEPRQQQQHTIGSTKTDLVPIDENDTITTGTTSTSSNTNKVMSVDWNLKIGRRGSRLPNSVTGNIHLPSVSLLMDNGNELIKDSVMDINRGHKYGLIGRNGCGKSTLLRRLANKDVPGIPPSLRTYLVQQQVIGDDNQTTIQALIESDIDRVELLQEQTYIEHRLDEIGTTTTSSPSTDTDIVTQLSERLNEITLDLDAIDADTIEERAIEILKGLQFTTTMINSPTSSLSGGWRMRLAIAQALIQINRCDLLLLDEVTNHLDLYGLQWLVQFLTSERTANTTTILVSHDKLFLDEVCTDIVIVQYKRLTYHVGNYTDYEQRIEERVARETQILDAAERQRTKAMAFIQKASSNSKSADPNKQRQAKTMKDKKLDRIGNYREDGKRYKNNSLKKLDESFVRTAQKVVIENDEKIIPMYFPNPKAWPHGIGSTDPIIRMEDFSFTYSPHAGTSNNDTTTSSTSTDQRWILNHVTLCLNRGSKVAVVGKNGTGKSTLCKLLGGEIIPTKEQSLGQLWIHPNIRIGHVTQYSVEELEARYGTSTVLEYTELVGMRTSKAPTDAINNTKSGSGNIRQYLGCFGLGDTRHVTSKIQHLSGGERMRLCFATVLANEPHLLLLDESTNHVDIETLESMSNALRDYEGTVIMVSHNQSFLSGFCTQLWTVNGNGIVSVQHANTDTVSFDELFTNYRHSLFHRNNNNTSILANRQRDKTRLAKTASKHDSTRTNRQAGLIG